jgi:outer membrane protein TolC
MRIALILAATAASALGQTNGPEQKAMSLEECITIALRHNLDVQIKRFNPDIARYTLDASYGTYDPTFNSSGGHDYNQSPGGFDTQGRPYGGTATDDNRLSAGFSGLLPWGMTYNLAANMTDTYGKRPGTAFASTYTVSTNVIQDYTNNANFISVRTTNFDIISIQQPFENVSGTMGLLQLRQPLLKNFWIDSTRLQIYLNKKSAESSEVDLRQQVMTSLTAVEEAYYNLIYAQQTVGVQRKALELAERLVAENKKRVEVGTLAPLDEKQAESQAAASRADLLAALGTEDTQQRVLRGLLSDDYSKWKGVSVKPTLAMVAIPEQFNLQESWVKGLSQRPDIQQQKISLEKQGYTIRFQKNQLFPQLDLVGGYGFNASAGNLTDAAGQYRGLDNPFYSVGGQISIPLGNRNARNTYRSAKAELVQMELQFKQIQQNALILIENDIATAKTAFQRVDATREARVYAEAALDAEQKKLESGKSTSFQVLQLQKDLTTASSAEIRALADYNIALAEIALAEGATLERRHVTMEVK